MTRVSPLSREVSAGGCGDHSRLRRGASDYDLLKLFHDEEFFQKFQENAVTLVYKYLADRVFSGAFR